MPIVTGEELAKRYGRMTEAAARAELARQEIERVPEPDYSYSQGLGAMFRSENLGYWMYDKMASGGSFGVDEAFDPEQNLGGYRQYTKEFPELLEARSSTEMIAIQNRIDQQLRDRRILQSFSFAGQLALAPAVLFSPENAIPFGSALRATGFVGKTALAAAKPSRAAIRSVLATGGRTSFEAAASAAVAESLLQTSQPFRTFEEGMINVVGSGVFGFTLGSAAKGLGVARAKALKELMGVESVAELDAVAEKSIARVLDGSTEQGKQLDEAIRNAGFKRNEQGLFEDSPATFVFSDKNPVRGLVLDALKEENPKLAKLMSLDNRFGRFVTGMLMFQPATRLARSRLQESRVISKILTGHFMVDEVPKGAKGLSVEGAISLAEIATLKMFREQDELYRSHAGALKGIGERVFEMVGYASRRRDIVSGRLSKRGGQDFDPFAEIRDRPDAIKAVEALAKANREILDIVFRTAQLVGAHTKGPRTLTDEQRVASLFDESYLPRLMDQDYIRLRRPQFLEAIRAGLEDARDRKVAAYEDDVRELVIQFDAATNAADRKHYGKRIDEIRTEIHALTDPAGFRDLAISVESNYRAAPGDRQVARQTPMRARTLEVDESWLEEFMVNDVRTLQSRLLRSVVPDLVLADQMDFRFGSSVRGTEVSLMRALAAGLDELDQRVEHFKENGSDPAGFDDLARDMGDRLDDADLAHLSNLIRLLDRVDGNDLNALRQELSDAYETRKRERASRLAIADDLRVSRQELAARREEARNLYSENRDLRDLDRINPDIDLTLEEWAGEFGEVAEAVSAAWTRIPPDEELLAGMHGDMRPEDWHSEAIARGYRVAEVQEMQRFVELALHDLPEGAALGTPEHYASWRMRMIRESWQPGLMSGPIPDLYRKIIEGLDVARTDKAAAEATIQRQTEALDVFPNVMRAEEARLEGAAAGVGEEPVARQLDQVRAVLSKHPEFIDLASLHARWIDRAQMEVRRLEKAKRKVRKLIDAEGDDIMSAALGEGRATVEDFTPRAEDFSALRAQRQLLIEEIARVQGLVKKAVARRDENLQRMGDSLRTADHASIPIERIAKQVRDQAGNAARSMAPEGLYMRRNVVTFEDGLSPDAVLRKVDALNRYVHSHTAGVRRDIFALNVGHEHLTKMMDRGFQRDVAAGKLIGDDRDLRALEREKDAVVTENERMRNRHGINDGDLAVWGKRLRDLNYMTSQGSILLASLPDVAMAITTAGMVPYANALARNLKTIFTGKFPKNTMAEWLYSVEMALGMMRHEKLLGIDDDFEIPMRSKFDARMLRTREAFTRLTMIRRWNAFNKAVAYQAIESRVAKALLSGDGMSKVDRQMLGFFGINEDDIPDLQRAVQIAGSSDDALVGKFHFLNTRDWRHENPAFAGWDAEHLRNLRLMTEGGILKGVYDTIITPSVGDLPAFATKTPTGRMLMQFRGWSLSILQRYTLPALQRIMKGRVIEDPGPALTAVFATVMGMAVFATQKWLRGEDPFAEREDEPLAVTWISEGMDRGGAFGFLSEATSSLFKVLHPLGIGFGPTSRFESRNALDAALGPTLGLAQDLVQLPYTFDDDFTEADTARVRRLIVGQNLLILRGLLDVGPSVPDIGSRRYYKDFMQIQNRAAEAVGLELD